MITEQTQSSAFGLHHDAWGRLVLIDREGLRHTGVEPIRAYPFTAPDEWISIRDSQGRELFCVERLADLSPATRQALETDLAQREFVPVIQRIVAVSSDTEPSQWDVETDRGATHFILNSEDDIRRFGPHRAIIIDAQGIRYLIPDTRRLDHRSRWTLGKYF